MKTAQEAWEEFKDFFPDLDSTHDLFFAGFSARNEEVAGLKAQLQAALVEISKLCEQRRAEPQQREPTRIEKLESDIPRLDSRVDEVMDCIADLCSPLEDRVFGRSR